MSETAKLTEAQKARIVALIENFGDTFASCLSGEFDTLHDDFKHAKSALDEDERNERLPFLRRQDVLCPAARDEHQATVDAFEAIREVRRLIEAAIAASKPALQAAE